MARSANTDPLLAHNFALLEVPVAGLRPLAFPEKTARSWAGGRNFIGFKSIELPEVTVEHKTIKEGNWPYVHSISTGFVETGDVTLEMAVFPTNTDMWIYFQQAVWGKIVPRRSFMVVQTRADKVLMQRIYWLENCVPKSWSPVSALDAQTSEVTIERLTLSVHRIRIIPTPTPLPDGAAT